LIIVSTTEQKKWRANLIYAYASSPCERSLNAPANTVSLTQVIGDIAPGDVQSLVSWPMRAALPVQPRREDAAAGAWAAASSV